MNIKKKNVYIPSVVPLCSSRLFGNSVKYICCSAIKDKTLCKACSLSGGGLPLLDDVLAKLFVLSNFTSL